MSIESVMPSNHLILCHPLLLSRKRKKAEKDGEVQSSPQTGDCAGLQDIPLPKTITLHFQRSVLHTSFYQCIMLPFRKTAKHTKAKSSLKRLNKHQNQSLIGHFPGGPVVRKPQFHCRDAGLIPGQRTRIPHAMCRAPQPKNKTKAKKKKSCMLHTLKLSEQKS